MRKLRAIRRDGRAVSPVIATILMVAITVVLAAVLYVMVSGLVPPGKVEDPVGIYAHPSTDGTNWTLDVTTAPSGLRLSSAQFQLQTGGGSEALPAAPLSTYLTENDGVLLVQVDSSSTALQPGDRILVDRSLYPAGHEYKILGEGSILAKGTFGGA